MNRRSFLRASTLSPVVAILASPTTVGSVTSIIAPVPIPPPSVDLSRLLDCIAQVESGRKDSARAVRNGVVVARGRYQLTAQTWFQWTNRPWTLAHSYFWSEDIAQRHVSWLNKNLPRISITEYHFRPFAIAWAWRAGLEAWLVRDKFPQYNTLYDDHASRVLNLYAEVSPQQVPNHPTK